MMKMKKCVKYEALLWVFYGTITVLAILDRFSTNYWPRQSFPRIGSESAGNDRIDGFKPGPWSVVLYDVMARVSGRFSICLLQLYAYIQVCDNSSAQQLDSSAAEDLFQSQIKLCQCIILWQASYFGAVACIIVACK